MKTYILAAAIIINLINPQQASAEDEQPRWSSVLGAVTCHNAVYEQHYVPNAGLETTTCKFANGDMYVFLSADEEYNTQCVVFSNNKETKACTEPEEMF